MSSTGLEPRTFILFILCRGVLAYAVAKRLYAVAKRCMPCHSGLFSQRGRKVNRMTPNTSFCKGIFFENPKLRDDNRLESEKVKEIIKSFFGHEELCALGLDNTSWLAFVTTIESKREYIAPVA